MSRRIVSGLYRNPYQLWMGLVLLLVAGVSSLMSLPRLEDPRLLNRFPGSKLVSRGNTRTSRDLGHRTDRRSDSRSSAGRYHRVDIGNRVIDCQCEPMTA